MHTDGHRSKSTKKDLSQNLCKSVYIGVSMFYIEWLMKVVIAAKIKSSTGEST
jgi:hypothetical protein